jgi:DNA-binding CsgD family transcriptional regulator
MTSLMTSGPRSREMGQRVEPNQVRLLVRLMGEASEFRFNDRARAQHLVSGLARILRATVGACVTDREPSVPGSYTPIVLEGWDGQTLSAIQALQTRGSDFHPCCHALMRSCPSRVGGVVTARRQDVVATHAWRASAFVQDHLGPARLDHPLFSRRRLNSAAVQGLGFYRASSDRPFTEEDRALLHLFHLECGPLPAARPSTDNDARRATLAPREAQTLDLLLAGHTDKEIADRLGIRGHTVNHYTKSIYRRFGVCSRAALLARLLGGEREASCVAAAPLADP